MTLYKLGFYIAIPTLFILGIWLFFQVVVDDGYIFFKYGYNWVYHGIWSWSTFGKPAEAYTSFIYALFSIFPFILNIPAPIFIKTVGLFFLILFLYRVSRHFQYSKLLGFSLLFLVSNWQLYVHAFSGLETILWCWLVLESFLLIQHDKLTRYQQLCLWVICLFMALNRPEGAIYTLAYFVYLQYIKNQQLHKGILVTVAGMGLIYFAIRYYYFGLLLPLPFYHKVADSKFGIMNVFINVYTSWHYIICTGLVLFFFRKNKIVLYLGILTFGIFSFLYAKSFLVMNYADRFSFQIFIPFLLFALISLRKENYVLKLKVVLVVSFLNLLIFSKGIFDQNFIELASISVNAGTSFYVPRSHYVLAKHINEIDNIEKKNIQILFGDAGVLPFYVKAKCRDYQGLTDAYFARHPITTFSLDSLHSDIILIGSPSHVCSDLIRDISNSRIIYQYVQANPKYEYLGYTISKDNGYYVHVFINKKSIEYNQLQLALKNAIQESTVAEFNFKRFINWGYLRVDKF